MKDSKSLKRAFKEKNDEFYTYYEDVEAEMKHYNFEGLEVYCNCDDYRKSNIVKWFKDNFEKLNLRGLRATNYSEVGEAYHYYFDGNRESVNALKSDGSYDSEECLEFLDSCDVVVTNPPFSKFKEYVPYLMQHEKKFIILGSINAVSYQFFFPYLQQHKVWLGYNITEGTRKGNTLWFEGSDGISRPVSAFWFSSFGEMPIFHLEATEKYDPEKYPMLDNYDAIEVSRFKKIPLDYDGPMAVPITAIKHYNPNEYELLGLACRNNTLLRSKWYGVKDLDGAPCLLVEGKPKALYARILIKRKQK